MYTRVFFPQIRLRDHEIGILVNMLEKREGGGPPLARPDPTSLSAGAGAPNLGAPAPGALGGLRSTAASMEGAPGGMAAAAAEGTTTGSAGAAACRARALLALQSTTGPERSRMPGIRPRSLAQPEKRRGARLL